MNFIMKLSWSEAKYKSENNALEEKKIGRIFWEAIRGMIKIKDSLKCN